jgi:tetratricopeptide (TPR) repeat protein
MKKHALNPRAGFLALSFFCLLMFAPPSSRCVEQSFDTADALTVGKFAAYGRVQSGLFNDALSAGQDTLKTIERRLGKEHPSIVPVLIDLATIYRHMARYSDAEMTLNGGLVIRQKSLGLENPLAAECLDHLASLYNETGRWEEAEVLEKRVISNARKNGGSLTQHLNHLGDIELNLKRFPQALSLLKQNLEIQETAVGTAASFRVETLVLLSKAYRGDGKPSEAAFCLQKALDIAKQQFQAGSRDLADVIKACAGGYVALHKKDQALPLYRQAHEIYKGFVGVDFSYASLYNVRALASLKQALGEYQAAGDLWQKALEAERKAFGARHPRVAVDLMNLAETEKSLGENVPASRHLKEALGMVQPLFGGDYPLVMKIQEQLASFSNN